MHICLHDNSLLYVHSFLLPTNGFQMRISTTFSLWYYLCTCHPDHGDHEQINVLFYKQLRLKRWIMLWNIKSWSSGMRRFVCSTYCCGCTGTIAYSIFVLFSFICLRNAFQNNLGFSKLFFFQQILTIRAKSAVEAQNLLKRVIFA